MSKDYFANDYKWLKEKFEEEIKDIALPESLKSENLLEKLDNIDFEQDSAGHSKKNVILFKVLSYAACFVLVTFGWLSASKMGMGSVKISNDAPAPASANAQVFTAESSASELAFNEESDTVSSTSAEMTDNNTVVESIKDAEIVSPESPQQASVPEIDV